MHKPEAKSSGLMRGVDVNKKKKPGSKPRIKSPQGSSKKKKKKAKDKGEMLTAKMPNSPLDRVERPKSRMEKSKNERVSCLSQSTPGGRSTPKSMYSVMKTKSTEEKPKQGSKKGKQQKSESPPMTDNEQLIIVGWLKEILAKSVADIAAEWQQNNPPQYNKPLIASSIANLDENRYFNMPCLEKSRVKVPGVKNDYIHANYVGTPENATRYICTQGPLDETIEKFWRMVVANGCEVILMLCDFMENGDEKCAKYYPDEQSKSMTFGPATIKCFGRAVEVSALLLNKIIQGGVVTTLLEVKLGEEKPSVVRHSKLIDWPDHLVPATTEPLLKMVRRIRKTEKTVVIHCSAGIGRTGTCLLVAMAQQEMRRGTFIGLWPLLQRIREQRPFAVQNNKQYVFAHLCLLERAGNLATKAGLDLEKFRVEYKHFMAGSSKKKKKRMPTTRTTNRAGSPDKGGSPSPDKTAGTSEKPPATSPPPATV